MKYASIDIGTNSVRVLMAVYDGTSFSDVQKQVTVTRLGKGVNETGRLAESSMTVTIDAVAEFVSAAQNYGAQAIYVMATSAARDAENSDVFLDRLADRTGIRAEIISGIKEAEIGFQGVLLGMPDAAESQNPQLVIDIGGGSTELIVGTASGILFSRSLNIGSVRMTGAYVESDPISKSDFEAMNDGIRAAVSEVVSDIRAYAPSYGIGIGGTAATFATVYKKMAVYERAGVHGTKLGLDAIREINERLKGLTLEARKEIIGLEPKRADVILAGGCILENVLEMLNCGSLVVSDSDNLEGFMAYCAKREKSS